MNKMIKVLIVVIVSLLLTTTLLSSNTESKTKDIHALLFKGSATLQKSYSSLFLLVNEITMVETTGQIDFLTAQDTIDSIKYTLLDSRDLFTRAKDMSTQPISDICLRKIGEITDILEQVGGIGNSLKEEKVPAKEIFRALNEKYLKCLRIDCITGAHSLND